MDLSLTHGFCWVRANKPCPLTVSTAFRVSPSGLERSCLKPNQRKSSLAEFFRAQLSTISHQLVMTTTLPEITLPVPDPQLSARRNGKIARLPKATRDLINRMLDDGLPYHVILDELGETGEGINAQNLTN